MLSMETTTTEAIYLNDPDHHLTVVQTVVVESPARVTDNGDIKVDNDDLEHLDVQGEDIHCATCGLLWTDDEYVAHGISDYWQLV